MIEIRYNDDVVTEIRNEIRCSNRKEKDEMCSFFVIEKKKKKMNL